MTQYSSMLKSFPLSQKWNEYSQVLSEPARTEALLHFMYERKGPMGAVTAGSRRGHRDHEVVEFNIFSVRRKKKGRIVTTSF